MIVVSKNQFRLLDGSMRRIVEANLPLAAHFHQLLFAAHPQLRALFPQDLAGLQAKFEDMLVVLVSGLTISDEVNEPLRQLAIRHLEYGAEAAHYPVVSDILLETLRTLPGADLSEAEFTAWSELLAAVTDFLVRETLIAQGAETI